MFFSPDSSIYFFGLKVHGTYAASDVSNTVVAPLKIPRIRRDDGQDLNFSQIRRIVIGLVSAGGTVVTAVGSFFGCKRFKKKGKGESKDLEANNKSGMLQGKAMKLSLTSTI